MDEPQKSQRSSADDNPVLLTDIGTTQAKEWLGEEHRRLHRFPVQASRPIALRQLDAEHAMVGRWLLVDILNISKGGMCLIVSGTRDFPKGQHLLLDVRAHPGIGKLRLEAEVCWCSHTFGFTTCGVRFLEPQPTVPRLEMEHRTEHRDPNDEPWAQE